MGIFKKLLALLHHFFFKGGELTRIATITGPAGATVSIEGLEIIFTEGSVRTPVSIATDTVAAVCATIDAMPGYTATVDDNAYSAKLARSFAEDARHTIAEDGGLYYPQNSLWFELSIFAWILAEQETRLKVARKQLYLDTSSAEWLDKWCAKFGAKRLDGETDQLFATRTINEVIRPTQNNKAIEIILEEALGVPAILTNAYPNREYIDPEFREFAAGRFLLDLSISASLTPEESQALIDKAKSIVRKYKAAGTDFLQTALSATIAKVEELSLVESIAVQISAAFAETFDDGVITYGSGLVYGPGDLTYGINNAIIEQVVVKTIRVSDDGVENLDVYGG